MKKSETITEYAKAFVKAQKEVKQPLKDKDNPFFKSKYVPLENVADAIVAAFGSNGLAYSQDPKADDNGNIAVTTLVMHESGEWVEYGPTTLRPVKSDPQSAGSAITYARRYALSAIFGITSDEDDDGNSATHPNKTSSSSKAKPTKKAEFITIEAANSYQSTIAEIAQSKGKQDGSVAKWFLDKLGVTDYKQITVNQIGLANQLINKLTGAEK